MKPCGLDGTLAGDVPLLYPSVMTRTSQPFPVCNPSIRYSHIDIIVHSFCTAQSHDSTRLCSIERRLGLALHPQLLTHHPSYSSTLVLVMRLRR